MTRQSYGKLFISLLLCSFLTITGIRAQVQPVSSVYNTTNWRFSNPKQFGFTVNDLDFFDNTRGIAVGANGGIAYTTNGGTTWSYGSFSFINAAGLRASSIFQDVHFVSASTAYAERPCAAAAKRSMPTHSTGRSCFRLLSSPGVLR